MEGPGQRGFKYGIMEGKNRQTVVRDHWEWRRIVL